jgi:alkylresorcinol/alkylpyrone synthase
MAYIAGTAPVFPKYYYTQKELFTSLSKVWEGGPFRAELLERFHKNVNVDGRYLSLPIEEYEKLPGFGERNDAWIQVALDLGERAVCAVLQDSGLHPKDISSITFINTTGLAVPSIDARLMNRIPFSKNLKRAPLFGLGCLGGTAGVARVADYLRGHPDEAALLLSIELCSLTLQRDDYSIANLIATGLFGDGAAAVLMVGENHPAARQGGPRVLDSRSIFFPDTEHIMGWDFRASGFKVLLDADVAKIAEHSLKPGVEEFLEKPRLNGRRYFVLDCPSGGAEGYPGHGERPGVGFG